MKKSLLPIIIGAALGATATSASAATLDDVKAKGFVQCGVNTGLPGFAMPNDQGEWTGFDVEFCRALAAAIFNDPTKVRFIPLTAKTASRPCNRAKSTCCRVTRPGRCRATPSSASISRP